MKNVISVIFSLFLFLTGKSFSMAAEQDFKGGKDHPLLTGMPDFRMNTNTESLKLYVVGQRKGGLKTGRWNWSNNNNRRD